MTMLSFPDDHAARAPDVPAYIMAGSGEVVTYAALVERSRRGAQLMRAMGIRAGDHIAIVMENHPRFLEMAWAAQRAGIRYTPMPSRATVAECAYLLADCGARLLVTSQACREVALAARDEVAPDMPLLQVDGTPAPDEDYVARAGAHPAEPLDDEEEGTDVLYSGGTTGRPKGIVRERTHAPIGTPPGFAALLAELFGFDQDTVLCAPAPMYHSAPLRFAMTVHRVGGTAIVMERFDAAALLQAVERHRITHLKLVPTMFQRLLTLPDDVRAQADISSLRSVIHAAAPCPPALKRQVIDWFGPIVHEFYSATENYLFTHITSEEWLQRPGSVGRPLSGKPHVLDRDTGLELPPGSVGALWSEGGPKFAYHNDPAKTADSRNDRGWTTVGDVGHVDEDGYVYLVDRSTDLILSGGVNIYPREIEDVLTMHPDVADVAVFGVPSERFGEEVKAVVQPRSPEVTGEALAVALEELCREQLSPYKCPRSFEFRDALPRSPTGKLMKRLLREDYLARP
ncbi:AMP-binding protein (plasmid) [Rhodococcus opacus]|uniref:AMP-binding protein n=1 Tax=Rhodococcus opacus TaxID=37919 RepID=UPI0034D222F1